MTKEEILEKSRNENKNQDIYDLEVQNEAARLSIYVTSILCCLSVVAVTLFKKTVPFEFVMILCGMLSTLFITKYVKMYKKHELFTAIIYILGFIISTILFIQKLIA